MCGIAGAAGVVVGDEAAERALLRMRRRGPDHQGSWRSSREGEAWLGHRRLAIVDLSPAGNHPMDDDESGLRLVCNGEIYNAPALRRELEGVGHRFRSGSDSEVILHGYARWPGEPVGTRGCHPLFPQILTARKQGFSARGIKERFDWAMAWKATAEGPWLRRGAWSPAWRRMAAPGAPNRENRLWTLYVLSRWAEGRLT